MASTRLRLASVFAVAAIAVGACSSTPSAPAGSGAAGGNDCTAGAAKGGANLQIPDVVAGQVNVAMGLIGPPDDRGWGPGPYEGRPYPWQHLAGRHVPLNE